MCGGEDLDALGESMLNRRKMLAVGGAAGAALLVSYGWRSSLMAAPPGPETHDHTSGSAVLSSPPFALFAARMPVVPELAPVARTSTSDLYHLPVVPRNIEILPGLPTPVLTFGGSFPGPTIRARAGRRVVVAVENQAASPANVHLHGGHVAPEHDGHPLDTIAPAATRGYFYPNTQQGATLWYHDHSHHTEAEHVYKGLHGVYIIDDPAEVGLNLPSGEYDVPISLRDALFDTSGNLVFSGNPRDRDVILANGVPVPHFPVAARKYRLRLVNAATERSFTLSLGGGDEMIQIASDGGLLPAPVARTEVAISSGERVEVVVDFARYPVGSQVVLYDATGPVLRFDVTRTAADRSRVPATLRELPVLPAATVTRDVVLAFDRTTGSALGVVNGKVFDPHRVDFQVRRGTTEVWNVHNADVEPAVPHNFHLHLVQFSVLSRNGGPPGPDDLGRKDTVMLAPGETVQVKAHFGTEHLGRYLYHCHFLKHSSLGMMATMEIVA
ncbi:Spore coat protein A [Actinokineospora sp. UTMC 2448]|nr:Spore coat protein A [Actinokineospora sp. UTMC 2448]